MLKHLKLKRVSDGVLKLFYKTGRYGHGKTGLKLMEAW